MPYPSNYIILGAGISGLTTAWQLQRQLGPQAHITVLEKTKDVGGWIKSYTEGDFFFEKGPRSLRISEDSRATLALIEELGLSPQLIGDAPASRQRYLWNGQQLQKTPTSLWQTLTSPLTRDLIGSILKESWRPRGTLPDESVYDFISRRYSPTMARRLIDPMLTGIYAGDINHLSTQACLPTVWDWEKRHGSVLKGWLRQRRSKIPLPGAHYLQGNSLFTLQSGLSTLPQTIAAHLNDLRLGCGVKQLLFSSHNVAVVLDDDSVVLADTVISTLPAQTLAPLLSTCAPQLHQQLTQLHSTSLKVVHLGWYQHHLPVEGFGYLVPSYLNDDILGVIFDSSTFPSQNKTPDQTRLTVMLGGAHRPDLATARDDTVITTAIHALKRHLGIRAIPDFIAVTDAPHSIPQYTVGHQLAIENIRHTCSLECPRLSILGSSFDGVALTSCINNSVLRS